MVLAEGALTADETEEDVFVRRGRVGGSRGCGRLGMVGVEVVFAAWVVPFAALEAGGGGGGGRLVTGGGALKFFCWLRAAMRSASELNFGSSTSAMVAS